MTKNNNSVAEVKTEVASAATVENMNVVETASTENMKEINPQAETPQVGVKEQPANGNGVVDQQKTKVAIAEAKWKPKEGPYSPWGTPQAQPPLAKDTDIEDAEYEEVEDMETLMKEDWEAFVQDTATACGEVDEKLFAGEEVQISDFLKAGYSFADMPAYLQRAETKKNVADLQKSLIKCKTFYRAIEVVPAKDFIEAGLGTPTRLDTNHTPITLNDPDIDYIWLRADGKQRTCAFANLFSSKNYKGKEGEYNVRVKICPSPIKNLPTYIREIQTAAVWDEKTKRQTTVAQFEAVESGLSLMNLFMEESKMTARGAYKLIFYKDGYKKSLYEESASSGTLHRDLQATPEIIKRAKHNYEVMKIAFRSAPQYLKNSAAVDALLDVYASATDRQNEAVEQFLTFLKTLGAEEFKDLGNAKTVADKKTEFLRIFEEFKIELATNPSFKDDVEEMVKKAEEEYKSTVTKGKKVNTKKVKTPSESTYYQIGAHVEV